MSAKRLVDLEPQWVGAGGEGITRNGVAVPAREGIGLMCLCPCGCGVNLYVPFANPLDGGPPGNTQRPGWARTGDTFDTLTLAPSIFRNHPESCGWHGWIRNGEIVNA